MCEYRTSFKLVLLFTLLIPIALSSKPTPNPPECSGMSDGLRQEIRSYQLTVNQIIQTAVHGEFKGHVYRELGNFVDEFGQRWTGTDGLEDSIDFMMGKMRRDGLINVQSSPVQADKWTRGEERAELLEPIQRRFDILGNAPSVSTPPEGLEADVIVFSDLDELEASQHLIPGKIVAFHYNFTTYNDAFVYLLAASSLTAKYGGIATLLPSSTPFSLNTPHSNPVGYDSNYPKIPTASLTIEDSALLRRIQERGQRIRLRLILVNTVEESIVTRNSQGELRGSTYPEEIVVVAGHIDSLDIGSGALDDGSGIFLATESLVLLQHLNLTPKRSIRAVLFTAEELGVYGAAQYVKDNMEEMNRTVAAMEADQGAFRPLGIDFGGSEEAACIMQEVLSLLAPINATSLSWYNQTHSVSSDISRLQRQGVPGIGLDNEGQWDRYFWFHHSKADSMSVLDSDELDLNLALFSAVSFVLADLSLPLPRDEL